MLNGLNYDRHAEIEAIEAFVETLKKGINEFKKDPVGIPMLSAWVRINAALPDFSQRIAEAVELDNEPKDRPKFLCRPSNHSREWGDKD